MRYYNLANESEAVREFHKDITEYEDKLRALGDEIFKCHNDIFDLRGEFWRLVKIHDTDKGT